jgi:hypothetical protein
METPASQLKGKKHFQKFIRAVTSILKHATPVLISKSASCGYSSAPQIRKTHNDENSL